MESESKKALRTQCAGRAFQGALYTLFADQSNQEERLFACRANKESCERFRSRLIYKHGIGDCLTFRHTVLDGLCSGPFYIIIQS